MKLWQHLLWRMTLLGLLCWAGVSAWLMLQLQHQASARLTQQADELQELVAAQLHQQVVAQAAGDRVPDLARVAAHFRHPVCLRYRTVDGLATEHGCQPALGEDTTPGWAQRLLDATLRTPPPQSRTVSLWARVDGLLEVAPSRPALIQAQWQQLRDLSSLTAATVLALDVLVVVVLQRSLRPTGQLLATLEQLARGQAAAVARAPAPPRRGVQEFVRLGWGIRRLARALSRLQQQRAELTARLIDAQETERRELARDLHDELGQCLAALRAVSAGIRLSAQAGEPARRDDTALLDASLDAMLEGLRRLLARLRPPPLSEQGLEHALAELVASWNQHQRLARADPRRAVLTLPQPWPGQPDPALALGIYRAAQEALTNAARHAPVTSTVRLQLRCGAGEWLLEVTNPLQTPGADGAPSHTRLGPEPHNSPPAHAGTGLGLAMMAERVASLGGWLDSRRVAGEFRLLACWPMQPPYRGRPPNA